jgi:hypothetical protein
MITACGLRRLLLRLTICSCGKCNKINTRLVRQSNDFGGRGSDDAARVSEKASRPDRRRRSVSVFKSGHRPIVTLSNRCCPTYVWLKLQDEASVHTVVWLLEDQVGRPRSQQATTHASEFLHGSFDSELGTERIVGSASMSRCECGLRSTQCLIYFLQKPTEPASTTSPRPTQEPSPAPRSTAASLCSRTWDMAACSLSKPPGIQEALRQPTSSRWCHHHRSRAQIPRGCIAAFVRLHACLLGTDRILPRRIVGRGCRLP